MRRSFLVILVLFSFNIIIANSCSLIRRPKNTDINFNKIQLNQFYTGQINDERIFVKFNLLTDDSAEGKFFFLTQDAFVKKHKFKIVPKRRSYLIQTEKRDFEVRLNIKIENNRIEGTYSYNKKFLRIFNRYTCPEDISLVLHRVPEFKQFPNRYREEIFDEIIVHEDIIYGSARGYYNSYVVKGESYWRILEGGILNTIFKRNLPLYLDVYMPDNDELTHRPLLMFIHGGGFYIGDKQTESIVQWSKIFASMGYTVVSIGYRIGFKPSRLSIERAGYRAIQDAHAAMRFLVHNRNNYGIDTSHISVAGSSAGAVTALHLAFMNNETRPASSFGNRLLSDLGNLETSTNSFNYDFSINTVINMWGAVFDINVINNPDISVLSFHCVDDVVVPYYTDYPFKDIRGGISRTVFDRVYGSYPIHQRLKDLGSREKLFTFYNQGHTPHINEPDYSSLSENFYVIANTMTEFLYRDIVAEDNYIRGFIPTLHKGAQPFYRTVNSDFIDIRWGIVGGLIISTSENNARVIWFEDKPEYKLYMSSVNEMGASSFDVYEFN